MDRRSTSRTWTLLGAAVLALTVGAMSRRRAAAPVPEPAAQSVDALRDAVAAPMPVAAAPRGGWIASPSVMTREGAVRPASVSRRGDQGKSLVAGRLRKVASAARARAERLRAEAAREVSVE